jgi:hypothetical protein
LFGKIDFSKKSVGRREIVNYWRQPVVANKNNLESVCRRQKFLSPANGLE